MSSKPRGLEARREVVRSVGRAIGEAEGMVDLMEIGTSQKQTTTMLPELTYPPENKNDSLAVLRHMFGN